MIMVIDHLTAVELRGVNCLIPPLQMVHVLSLIAMVAMTTHHYLRRYFLTCD